ncbi:MAG TPA: GLUG motif-containing protein, partial [Balneolaceae bacterium]|nr:GLUG motif-containing protein [Balneolaceae bacterium]
NDGSVKNSSATGSAKISSSTAGAGYGGLVGDNYKTITHSYANVTVSVSKNVGDAGGLVGFNPGTIQNSYATGSVSGAYFDGGLVGVNYGKVQYCYSTGVASGTSTGGLIALGDKYDGGSTTDSYWDKTASGLNSSNDGTGLTTSQMQGSAALTNMTGFDFTNVWKTNTGGYPTLR